VQLGWGVLVLMRPSRPLLALGAMVQLDVIALWAVTRTVGLPFGPDKGQPEAVAFVDVFCSVLELITVLAAVVVLAPKLANATWRRPFHIGTTAAAVALVVVGTTAALTPGLEGAHAHGGSATHTDVLGHTHVTPTASGDIPKGWVAGCLHHHDVGHASGACTNDTVQPWQRQAAEQLVSQTTSRIKRKYPTLQAAEKAGYVPLNITGDVVHVGNPTFQTDGRILDPDRVESLVYLTLPNNRSLLMGAMYIVDPPMVDGPLIGGALTSWHVHTNLCVSADGLTAFNPGPNNTCQPGASIRPTAQMLHVWAVNYPGGPFADLDAKSVLTVLKNETAPHAGH
jgi:hypothetical protein